MMQAKKPGRKSTDPIYQLMIYELITEYGLEKKPSQVAQMVEFWAKQQQRYDYPALPTVKRIIKALNDHPPEIERILIKPFSYPDDMDFLGWEHNRTALDCLAFYLSECETRPPVGLVRWFIRMWAARESHTVEILTATAEIHQVALYAEALWFRDLVAGFGKSRTANSTGVELRLAFKTWDSNPRYPSAIDTWSKEVGQPLVEIPLADFSLLHALPLFSKHLPQTDQMASQETINEVAASIEKEYRDQ